MQLTAGLLLSFICFGMHATVTGVIILLTRGAAARTDSLHVFARLTALLLITVFALLIAHIAEIGAWALLYDALAVTPSQLTAFEFAFENYTALGYGNPLPDGAWRLIGPFTALNGLLLIGWSVAIIFEVMRMAEVQIRRVDQRARH
jgi:hypothetical protein